MKMGEYVHNLSKFVRPDFGRMCVVVNICFVLFLFLHVRLLPLSYPINVCFDLLMWLPLSVLIIPFCIWAHFLSSSSKFF